MSDYMTKHRALWGKNPKKVSSVTATAAVEQSTLSNEDEIWFDQIMTDWNQLKSIGDHAERDKNKPAVLDKYREYLTDLISKENYLLQNPVLQICLILSLDIKDFALAIELADFASKTRQHTSLIKRELVTFTCDTIRGFTREDRNANVDSQAKEAFKQVFESVDSHRWKVALVTEAKMYRMAGLLAGDTGDVWNEAMWLTRANEIYPGVNVKTKMLAAQKKAAAMQPE